MDVKRAEIHEVTDAEKIAWENENKRLLARLSEAQVNDVRILSKGRRKKYMKHQPCPCKSGKKFFKCCWHLYTR